MLKIHFQLLLNASPVILAAIFHMIIVKIGCCQFLLYPLDHKTSYRGKRIFGPNKTYRGLLMMILFSLFFTYLYSIILKNNPSLNKYNLLDFEHFSVVFYGILLGLAYVLGELPNSFIKRQMGVESGKANSLWMHLFDQIDSVLVIMLLLVFFSSFSWKLFFIGILFYGLIHILINYLLFLLGLRREAF